MQVKGKNLKTVINERQRKVAQTSGENREEKIQTRKNGHNKTKSVTCLLVFALITAKNK